LGTYHNIISKENKKVTLDQSQIDDLLQEIERLQISLNTVRTRIERVAQNQGTPSRVQDSAESSESSNSEEEFNFILDKDPQIAAKQTASPSHKWGYSIGDFIKITNSLKIAGVKISDKNKRGQILYFTNRFIAIDINYKVIGISQRKVVNREPPNVILVKKYNHEL